MPTLMSSGHDLFYVALSFVISAVGAFVGLSAIVQMNATGRAGRLLNLASASVALGGIGIWSMHFIGMLSLRMAMGVSYSLPETLVSLVAAIGAAALALQFVAKGQSLPRLLGAGTALGLAVCVMHYLGMYGMRFNGFFQWSSELVGVSIVIALVAATAGLWLAFAARGVTARLLASVIIAGAVCSMHYTGMAAASFVCTSSNPSAFPAGAGLITSLELPVLVTALSLGMAAIIAIDQFMQRVALRAHVGAPAMATAGARRRMR
jgi:NO-binding membrane sensor protein with MHYT domain